MHLNVSSFRRRKISSKERKWEESFSNPFQTVIMWPEQAPDQIDILTTLYRSQHDDQYDDKVTFLVFVFMSRSPTTKINKTL